MNHVLFSRFQGCLLGLAVGDAIGTTVEFRERGTFAPVTDMVGGGPFSLLPGEWTDDTSMALCLAASLLECGGFDAEDQVERYIRWRDQGYMSSNGRCFDIGGTVSSALFRYELSGHPYEGSTHPRSAGNGCIMRLAPVPMFYLHDQVQAVHFAAESSRTTHGASECLEACMVLSSVLCTALEGADKEAVINTPGTLKLEEPRIISISRGEYRDKLYEDIRGTGYVVDCLEAALWCFSHTDSFEGAVLAAVNLGDDADTTAAVCGQIAGAFYGIEGVPGHWLERLALREEIQEIADSLFSVSTT